ncbi:MAG: alpha/beta hydrolase [Deltaproteobacteria bacterium]|nr:alpha/beta hydrolase [Deltaproteobacteria bacterium]
MAEKNPLRKVLFMPIHWAYLVGFVLILAACTYLFYPRVESFFIYFPQSHFDFRPEEFRLAYKDAYFDTEDGEKLHGWLFQGAEAGPVILHSHGNAGNMSHRLDLVQPFLRRGLSVFLFDYRGFGKSSGRPSETGLYRDGIAAWTYLAEKEKIAPERIVLHGHSIGAAVAIEVALEKKVRGLVIESAFTSTKDMAKGMALFALFSPLLPAHYNNIEKISHLTVPKLIVHGDRDEIVPFSMGQKLFEAALDPKFFYPVKDAGHNDVFVIGGEKYFEVFAEFARNAKIAKE